MRVRIVCYEDVNAWILGKFALNLNKELNKLGIRSDIGGEPDTAADINHHIAYMNYSGAKTACDTLMITHVDRLDRALLLGSHLKKAGMGICMSLDALERLSAAGLPRKKLCCVNPAHDGLIKPRPLVIGITSKLHDDGRKLERTLLKLCDSISPEDFMFRIMGSGWELIVKELREKGFTAEYSGAFDYTKYIGMVPTFDYYLYFSHDEGSMGFIDALAAGVKTIVTPQGFHLDAPGGITYPVSDLEELKVTFHKIADERSKLVNSVRNWTWANYARKHAQIWEYVLDASKYSSLILNNVSDEKDGIASVSPDDAPDKVPFLRKTAVRMDILIGSLRTLRRNITNIGYPLGIIKKKILRLAGKKSVK